MEKYPKLMLRIMGAFNKSEFRYLLVGSVVYLIDFCSFIIAFKLGLGALISNIVGKLSGGTFGFFAHRYFTFKVKHGLKSAQAIRYFVILAFYAPFSSFILKLIMYLVHGSILARLVSDIICIILSYLLTKYIVFMKKPQALSKNII